VGITCLTPSDGMVRNLGSLLRARGFKGHIFLGNTHASICAESFLKTGSFNAVVHGEGEVTFNELLDAVDNGSDFENIHGLTYVRHGVPVRTAPRNQIANLDNLPMPAWEKTDIAGYNYNPFIAIYEPYMFIQASRGCPYNCYFCTQEIYLKKYRKKSVSRTLEETAICVKKHGIRHIGYLDSYFPPDQKWGYEFVDGLKANFKNHPFRLYLETRVDMVKEDLFCELDRLGARSLIVGFESGVPETLKRIGKKTTVEQGREAMRILKKTDILTIGFFIIGFPWETESMVRETIDYAIELAPDLLKFNIAIPLPGSKFHEDFQKNAKPGQELDYNRMTAWTDFSEGLSKTAQTFSLIPPKNLLKLQRNGTFRYYLKPKVLWNLARQGVFRPRNLVAFIAVFAALAKGLFTSMKKANVFK